MATNKNQGRTSKSENMKKGNVTREQGPSRTRKSGTSKTK